MLGLPYNRRVGLAKAADLFSDIGGLASLESVSRLQENTNTLQIYKGTVIGGGPNFPLNDGECYFVRVDAGLALSYVVVGSHDPALAIDLAGPGGPALPDPGVSKSGQNMVALPYHFAGSKASDLLFDIGGTTVVGSVGRLVTSSDTIQIYKGTPIGPGPNFALTPSECYFVNMRGGAAVLWTPSHY